MASIYLRAPWAIGTVLMVLPAALTLLAMPVLAQVPAAPAPSPPAEPAVAEDPLGRTTPRGAVMGFIRAAQRQDYELAAEYLDTQDPPARAQEHARQLQVVLDLGMTADLDNLSRKPEGDLDDGLRLTRDRVGTVVTSSAAWTFCWIAFRAPTPILFGYFLSTPCRRRPRCSKSSTRWMSKNMFRAGW